MTEATENTLDRVVREIFEDQMSCGNKLCTMQEVWDRTEYWRAMGVLIAERFLDTPSSEKDTEIAKDFLDDFSDPTPALPKNLAKERATTIEQHKVLVYFLIDEKTIFLNILNYIEKKDEKKDGSIVIPSLLHNIDYLIFHYEQLVGETKSGYRPQTQ